MIAWIFFRSESIGHAFIYLSGIFSPSLFSIPRFAGMEIALTQILFIIVIIILFVLTEWSARQQEYGIANLGYKWKRPFRYTMYYSLILAIFWFGGKEQQFIYFQF